MALRIVFVRIDIRLSFGKLPPESAGTEVPGSRPQYAIL